MKTKILGLLAVGLLAGPLGASAGNLYSNLGAGDSFSLGSAWITTGVGTASQFVATASGNAVSVDAGVWGDASSTVQFTLYSDSGSDTLGNLLGSTNSQSAPASDALISLAFGSSLSLVAGQKYWLLDVGGAPWAFNTTGATGLLRNAFGTYLGPVTLPNFRINASVPEPGTLALLGLGLAGLGLSRRRKAS